MTDQMDVFQGQKDPLTVRWAVEGSGNPLDFQDEVQKANHEMKEIQASQLSKRQKIQVLKQGPEDIHKDLTIEEKAKIDPAQLVPQLANLNKRT